MEIRKYFELKENNDTRCEIVQSLVNAVVKGKFIALSTYNRKEVRQQVNDLTSYFNELGNKEQTKPKEQKSTKQQIGPG